MRRYLSILAAAAIVLAATSAAMAETTKTLKIEYAPTGTERVTIENLAGSMRVSTGSGDRIVAVATVHAESDDVAAKVRFEEVKGESGGSSCGSSIPRSTRPSGTPEGMRGTGCRSSASSGGAAPPHVRRPPGQGERLQRRPPLRRRRDPDPAADAHAASGTTPGRSTARTSKAP